jgi:hypothetical protein
VDHSCPKPRGVDSKGEGSSSGRRQDQPPPLGFSSTTARPRARRGRRRRARRCRAAPLGGGKASRRRGAHRRRTAPGGEGAGNQGRGSTDRDDEPGKERDEVNHCAVGERLHRRNINNPPSTGRPRLHLRPTVSTAAILISFPLPCFLSVLTPSSMETHRCEMFCLCAGLRAA